MYGTSSFGMTVHFHFCCGKLRAVDLNPPKDNHCNKSTSYQMGEKPCCENKQVELKVSGEQEFAKVYYSSFSPDAIKPLMQDLLVFSPVQAKRLVPEIFAPPPTSSNPIYILNSVFRI